VVVEVVVAVTGVEEMGEMVTILEEGTINIILAVMEIINNGIINRISTTRGIIMGIALIMVILDGRM
jgi:hypothetical protein